MMAAGTMRRILLSGQGGDRATGYAMSNKILRLPEGFLCTWIDCRRQNRWALVDGASGTILREGELGQAGADNHCGAAIALAGDGVHAVTGGHHGPLRHYRFEAGEGNWREQATLEVRGTYPSLVADQLGTLHLAFRSSGERWTLDYCRFENGLWTPPQSLVRASMAGYIYWTNGLAAGPDGSVHLVFGNTTLRSGGSRHFSASHLVSPDGGRTWRQACGAAVQPLVAVADLPILTGKPRADRMQSPEDQRRYDQPGPGNFNYQQMVLSNPVVDGGGTVHVVLHNGLDGTAEVMAGKDGEWTTLPLAPAVAEVAAGCRIHMQSSLSMGPSGRLHAVLMVAPGSACVWGPAGTHLVRVAFDADGTGVEAERLTPPDPACAQWLPALEQPGCISRDHLPALLYTKGVNAGGFGNNQNDLETEVFLCLPQG